MKLTSDEFSELVQQALVDIPEPLVGYMRDVTVDIEPMPDVRDCRRVGINDPRRLLGLYQGTPLTQRSVEHVMRLPDRITIYQCNIERICSTRGQIMDQVRRTVFHEVGHHFGLDETELESLGF